MNDSNVVISILGEDGVPGVDRAAVAAAANSEVDGTGQPGKNGDCTGGGWFSSCKCVAATNGTDGANAPKAGEPGGHGGAGAHAPEFILNVGKFTAAPGVPELVIISRGGKGGKGGNGGAGGDGAPGGKAGQNTDDCVKKGKVNLAQGGFGGNGSNGGPGGDSGAGGDGGDVTIYYTQSMPPQINATSPGGLAGDPGSGGAGGVGGKGGENEIWPRGGTPEYQASGYDGVKPAGGNSALPGDPGLIKILPQPIN